MPVERKNDVTLAETRPGARAALRDVGDERALGPRKGEARSEFPRHFLELQAEPAAPYPAPGSEFVDDRLGEIRGNGEGDAYGPPVGV